MSYLSFDALQATILYELYSATVVDGLHSISATVLAERVGGGATAGYVGVALAEMDRQSLVSYSPSSPGKSSSITPTGIRSAEKDLVDKASSISKIRDAKELFASERGIAVRSAPAADRIVRVNDNGGPALEIVEAAEKLVKKLKTGNDLGDLTPEQANAAAAEVYQIEAYFKGEFVREDYIIISAQKSLRWIADKSGGAVIGKAALSLLTLIAGYFGLTL